MRNRKHDIEKYLRGELSDAEMHALEKAALSDPFLAEALEGVEQAGPDNFLYDLHKINRSVHDRMRQSSGKNRQAIRMWGWMSGVAATILLIAVAGFLVVNMLQDQQARNLSTVSEVNPPIADSLPVDTGHLALKEKAAQAPAPPATDPAAISDAGAVTTTEEEEVIEAAPKQEPAGEAGINDSITEQVLPVPQESVGREETIAPEIRRKTESLAAVADEREVPEAVQQRSAGIAAKRAPSAMTQMSIAPRTVKGKVTDENGLDLRGVNVNVQGTTMGTITDVEGRYELTVPSPDATLVFNFIGFEPREISLPDGPELNVILEENIATLSEVVITGYADSKPADDNSFRSAEPAVGKSDFKVYLANSVKYPQEAVQNKIEGKVTIRFTVEPTGQLSNFEVLKGIGSGCEEELIRAVREGPQWKPGAVGDQPVRNRVRVRYKFQLPD